MIVRITRGGRSTGLAMYLVGEGKRNEHTNPHVVAGHPAVVGEVSSGELGTDDALDMANALELPSKVFGTQVTVPVKQWNEELQQLVKTGSKDAHVWHASLAIGPDDGVKSDEMWQKLASDFVEEMGFAGESVEGAQCRWVAVRHGVSANGNDHVHVVVNLVREDGTKANINRDYKRAQTVANKLERRHGLTVLQGRETGQVALPGYSAAEQAKVDRGALSAVEREDLHRRVSAVAVASGSEKEFLEGLRRARVLVRPRLEKGTTDKVVGYSVALVPQVVDGRRSNPVWFAPSKLDRTLGLGRLRTGWGADVNGDPELTPMWRGQWKRRDVAERVDVRARPEVSTEALARLGDKLSVTQSRAAAADVAGILSRASLALEQGAPGPIARAAREFAREAQPPRWESAGGRAAEGVRTVQSALYRAELTSRAVSSSSSLGWMAVMRQAQRSARAIAVSQHSRGQGVRAVRTHAAAQQAFKAFAQVGQARPTRQGPVDPRMRHAPGMAPGRAPDLGLG